MVHKMQNNTFLKVMTLILMIIASEARGAQDWFFQARGGSVAGTIDRPETKDEKSVQVNFGGFESTFGIKKFNSEFVFHQFSIKYLYDVKLDQFTRESYQYKFGYIFSGGAPVYQEYGPSMVVTHYHTSYWAFIVTGSLDSYSISSKKESNQQFQGDVVQSGLGLQYSFEPVDKTHIALEISRENFSISKSTDRIVPASLQFSLGVNRQL